MEVVKKFSYSLTYLILMGLPAAIVAYFVRGALDVKALLIVTLIALFIGGIFDIWAVKQGKKDKFYIWEYSRKTTLGLKILGVPFEDYFLFLVITPVLIISLWEAVKRLSLLKETNLFWLIVFGLVLLSVSYRLAFRLAKKKR